MRYLILFLDHDGPHGRLLEGSADEARRAAEMLREKYDLPDSGVFWLETSGFQSFGAIADEYEEHKSDLADFNDQT